MKELFRKKDLMVNPVTIEGDSNKKDIIELPTFYNGINNVLTSDAYYKTVTPVDQYDLNLMRENLVLMFKNRVRFLFNKTIEMNKASLNNLAIKYREESDMKMATYIIDGVDRILNDIEKDIPYIFDLTFYFNIDLDKYSSLNIIAMNMTSILYNKLDMYGYGGKTNKIEEFNNMINNIFTATSMSFFDDLMVLCQEARTVYFEAANYDYNESKEEFINPNIAVEAIQEPIKSLSNDFTNGAATEDQIVEHFRRFLKEEVYGI